MTPEDTFLIVEQALEPKQLNKIQQLILQHSWQGHSYAEIAKATGYDCGYIKDSGSKLWQILSNSIGEKVNKQNCQAVLNRYCRQKNQPATSPQVETLQPSQDWGEATDTSLFYGRSREVTTLNDWIVKDKCHLIALLGIGGVGKTTLAAKVTEDTHNSFKYLFWRSLKDAIPLTDLLTVLLQFLSNGEIAIATTESGKLSQLLEYLRLKQCLIVLDNFDTVFASGQRVGIYREGYEGYGELLKRVGESRHQSCMVITSRDKPLEIAILQGERSPVRELSLRGLDAIAAQKLLIDKELQGSGEEFDRLVDRYQGNPLALKIAATSIRDLFDGCVAEFLKQQIAVFNGIRYLLKPQIDRLSSLEEQMMYWLAINRESIDLKEIQFDLVPSLSLAALLEILESLRWRSLVEKTADGFTQQPVVMEYMTEQFVDRVCKEIVATPSSFPIAKRDRTGIVTKQSPTFLNRYAILKATSKDYIQDSQKRAIVEPIIVQAIASLGSKEALVSKLKQLLKQFRTDRVGASNYAIGNILSLFNHLKVDATGFDAMFLVSLSRKPTYTIALKNSSIS